MKYTNLYITLLLALLVAPFASAALTVGDVSLPFDDAVDRSNPLPERSDSSLDDASELSYVTFSIPVTASTQDETITSVTPNLNGFTYDSFAGNYNASAKYIVDTTLPLTVVSGQTQNINLRILVPSNLDSVDSSFNELAHSLTASLATSAGAKTSTLSFYVENALRLKKVTIITSDDNTIKCKVNEDEKSLDCDSDADELMRGKNFDVEFTVENALDKDSELDLSNIDISVDSDNSDIEPADDSYDEDIDADEEQVFTVTFDVDDNVDDGDDAQITIEASVEDDNNANHGFLHEFSIQFDTKSYEIAPPIFSLSPSAACPGEIIVASFTLENLGSKRQPDVRPILVSDGLALNKVLPTVNLKEEDASGNVFRGTANINVPASTKPGSYPIQLQTYFRDEDSQDAMQMQSATLTVQTCTNGVPVNSGSTGTGSQNTNSNQQTGNGLVIVQPGQSQPTTPSQTVPTTTTTNVPVRAVISDSSDMPFIIGLGIAVLILIIIVGALFAAVMRK